MSMEGLRVVSYKHQWRYGEGSFFSCFLTRLHRFFKRGLKDDDDDDPC